MNEEKERNCLFQIQFSDLSNVSILNGDFENFTGGVPDNWTKTETGSSTVTQETVNLRPGTTGSSAVRFTYDATPNVARISQTTPLLSESFYRLGFWIYCSDPLTISKYGIRLRDAAANVYLQDNGTWSSTLNDIEIDVYNGWYFYTLDFITHPDYTSYFVGLGNGNAIKSAYIIIDDLSLALNTSGVSIYSCTVNDFQYIGNVRNEPVSIINTGAHDGILNRRGLSLKIEDSLITNGSNQYRKYRSIIQGIEENNMSIVGRNVIVRNSNGNVLQRYRITGYTYIEENIIIELSNSYGELYDNRVLDIIDERIFTEAPESSTGQFIPFFVGQFLVSATGDRKGETNYITAWRIQSIVGSNPSRYIIGYTTNNIVVFSGSQDFQYVLDENNSEIPAASCTLITPTGTTGKEKYHYIDINYIEGNFDYVKVHFKSTAINAEQLIQKIGDGLFNAFKFDLSGISGILASRNYNKYDSGNQHFTDPRILINGDFNYTDILTWICDTFSLSYVVGTAGTIDFKYNNLKSPYLNSITTQINDDISDKFTITRHERPYGDMENRLNYEWADGIYKTTFDNIESQISNKDIRSVNVNANLFSGNTSLSKRHAWFSCKDRMIQRHNARDFYTALIPNVNDEINGTSTMSDLLQPMKILSFKNRVFPDGNRHYMQVREIERKFPDNQAIVQFLDLQNIAKTDSNATLLLQSNSDNLSFDTYDKAPNGYHLIDNVNKSVKHDIDRKLFSKSVFTNANATPNIEVGPYGFNFGLNPFISLSPIGTAGGYYSFTVSFWAAFENLATQEAFLTQYSGVNNYWIIYKDTSNKVKFILRIAGTNIINMTSSTSISKAKWFHVCFHRSNDGIGLYIDGKQESWNPAVSNYLVNEPLNIFNDGNSANYFDGSMQDIYFAANPSDISDREKGWFNCNPNSGNTDLFQMPTGLMSIFFRKYWTYKKTNI